MTTRSRVGPGAKAPLISKNPNVLGGLPVFAGTRVPVRALFQYLEAGDTLEEFLENFPNVRREQAIAVIEAAEATLLA